MLLSHIQNHLGFSMSFTPIPGVNGSSHWGRTFSVIRDGLFDLSPSSWTVSHARHALVDFTFPTVTVTVGFGIRTPDAETDTTAFLRPFDESAYAGVVLLLVLLATAAWLLDNRSRLLGEESRSVQDQVILLTGFATGILVCNFYNSGLYSHLTATRAAMPFSSVTELFRDSSFTIGAQVSFYFSTALSRLTGFSVTEVDRRLENHLGIHDREIERLIAKPQFAFLMTSTAFKLAVRVPPWQADRCPSCFVPLKGVPPEERAIIFRKGLDAEHGIMNRQLLRLWEGGVLARERAYWLPETLSESYRCHPGARGWDAIAVSQVYPLFVLLLTSAAVSLLLLAAEIIHFRWSRNGRKRGTSRS
ncbi:uncharacterized protein LOC122393218 [Amphibalanus amphitrite]|uniref:uncharacterized protein LOC122393218 n=1 Tax=Amphibalanus amphitrite TaxID=1232801 RepID=UPI001C9240F7|nr:uncharacterized protein LOC122393218 [Amphibalanus amphitrite]